MKIPISTIRRTIFLLLAITLFLSSCSRDEESTKTKEKKAVSDEKEEKIDVENFGRIEEFNPELYVKFTILYKNESKKWLQESASLKPEEQKRYFDEASLAFFERFGITEEEYIDYGREHTDELDRYIEEHPELSSTLQSY